MSPSPSGSTRTQDEPPDRRPASEPAELVDILGGPNDESRRKYAVWKQQNPKWWDIALQGASGRQFLCNRLDLAVNSDYFDRLFNGDFGDADKRELAFEDIAEETLSSMVEALYSRQMLLTKDNVQPILVASDRLQLAPLAQACEGYLARQLSRDSLESLLALSAQLHLEKLAAACWRLMKELIPTDILTMWKLLPLNPNDGVAEEIKRYAAVNFQDVCCDDKGAAFLSALRSDELLTLLSRDDIYCQEWLVFEALESAWPGGPDGPTPEAVTAAVRVEHMPLPELAELLNRLPAMADIIARVSLRRAGYTKPLAGLPDRRCRQVRFVWRISDWGSSERRCRIFSPHFTLAGCDAMQWLVMCDPRGSTAKDSGFVSLYLQSVLEPGAPPLPAPTSFRMTLEGNGVSVAHDTQHLFSGDSSGIGWPRFVDVTELADCKSVHISVELISSGMQATTMSP